MPLASSVASGRSRYRVGGLDTTFWEALRDSLGALPGSIFSVMSPPTTSSCSLLSGVGVCEGSRLVGEWEAERDFTLGGNATEVGMGAASSSSNFTRGDLSLGWACGESSSIFMSRSSGPNWDVFFSLSLSDMAMGGVGLRRCR